MTPLDVVTGLSVVFSVLLVYGLVRRAPDATAALRKQYLALVRLSVPEGKAQLAERLEQLSLRFPGRSHGWYLRWLVTDLERAKR